MPNLPVPQDGRLTSQNVLGPPLDATAVMYIVSPGDASLGNSYQVTLAVLAQYFAAAPVINTTFIKTGATLGNPYNVPITATRLLFDKTVPSASYAVCPLAASMGALGAVVFKDFLGDADVNPITITFTGGELCDGLDTITISASYGWVSLYPTPGGGSWYMGP